MKRIWKQGRMIEEVGRRYVRTSLPNEQEEPHTPREVQQQRQRVARVPQQVGRGEEGPVELAPDPARPDAGGREDRVGRRVVRAGGAADEGRREAPGESDEEEGDDVVGRGRVRGGVGVGVGVSVGGHCYVKRGAF